LGERVIIDTDPGIDDAMALLLALQSPALQIAAVTTVSGNVPVDTGTRNVFTVFSLLPEIPKPPVAKGASRPMQKDPAYVYDVHGKDGLGGIYGLRNRNGQPRYPHPEISLSQRGAVDEILHHISTAPDAVTLIALGPLTNVALAIQKDRAIMVRLKRIVIMGGALSAPGNITPAAEFNMFVDPHAAAVVFTAGIPITLVPLDVTGKVALPRESLVDAVASKSSTTSQFLADCTRGLFTFMEHRGGKARFHLHDPLAVGIVIDPSLVHAQDMHIAIETEGRFTQGMTVADRRPIKSQWKEKPNVSVCTDVDHERFLSFFMESIL
jgi:purine nucleosidase/pyrimidine-specific ribonucleoside hydrolase